MAYLEIETRNGTLRVSLNYERLTIGRLDSNDIMLPFAQVSRQHAELHRVGGQWWISDLHSTNGLHLNSRRIQDHALEDGDKIVLAPDISLRFVRGDLPSSPITSKAPSGSAPAWSGAALAGGSASANDEAGHAPHPLAQTPSLLSGNGQVPTPAPWGAGITGVGASSIGSWSTASAGSAQRSSTPANGAPFGTLDGALGEDDEASLASIGGYPVPAGPLVGGNEGSDVYRRSGATAGPAGTLSNPSANLLHVCQTCGQLTAPNAVYCQYCRQPIAHECAVCRLNLLPIQDRCPRCHTANVAYVGRAHVARPGM